MGTKHSRLTANVSPELLIETTCFSNGTFSTFPCPILCFVNNVSQLLSFSSRKLDRHIKGREIQCRTLEIALERFGDELTDVQKKHLEKEIIYRKKAINALKERNTLELFGQLFRWGKMDNKAIDISNFLLAFREKLRGDNI